MNPICYFFWHRWMHVVDVEPFKGLWQCTRCHKIADGREWKSGDYWTAYKTPYMHKSVQTFGDLVKPTESET